MDKSKEIELRVYSENTRSGNFVGTYRCIIEDLCKEEINNDEKQELQLKREQYTKEAGTLYIKTQWRDYEKERQLEEQANKER